MKKITNSSARSYVENRKEFTANNLSAKQIGDAYVVLSYGYYPIFVYADGTWYENSSKYSNTTAKQMSQSRPNANKIFKVSTNELKELVMKHGKGKMYAKGGLTEHGLKIGDKITSDKGDRIEIYNKKMREDGYVNLDTGDRRTHKYAKGGATKSPTNMEVWKNGDIIDYYPSDVGGSNQSQDTIIEYNGKKYLVVISMHGEDVLRPTAKASLYDEDEYGKGGIISVGDKVKIKGTNKTMTVREISKGKKGYVEFSGDGGTYLIGDLEKYAKGGSMKKRQGGEAPYITAKNDEGVEETVYLTSMEDGYDVESELSDALEGEFTITDLSTELKSWLPSEKGVYYFDVDAVTAFCQALDLTYDTGIEMDTLAEIYKDFRVSDLEEFFRDNYEGNFKNNEDFAYNYIESIGGVGELSDSDLQNYFDYASFGRDLAMDFTEYDGHYFRNT